VRFKVPITSSAISSDAALIDLLRKHGPLSVPQLASGMEVTATAVRQRLTRLLAQGDIERHCDSADASRARRGRPLHRYALTEKGRRRGGSNFSDLAIALWQEVREIKQADVRQGLLARLSRRLATLYAGQVRGSDLSERMESLAEVFRQRQIPFEVDRSQELPILHANACPYPDLAEQDRGICALEKMMFSELLGESVRLSSCRLDGHNCCTFEPATRSVSEGPTQTRAVSERPTPTRSVSERPIPTRSVSEGPMTSLTHASG
jgi:DeoR family transcriptional regulator, suf operon transcriptional repressor